MDNVVSMQKSTNLKEPFFFQHWMLPNSLTYTINVIKGQNEIVYDNILSRLKIIQL